MDTKRSTITVTVDGLEVECQPGELLIEVAKRAGIYIPFFCYHPRMDPVGACRMCLVHIEGGPPKPQTSCTTRVADGMVVETQFANPDIQKAQSGVLEFLLLNHPLDCPICDRGGECPLQDQAQDYGSSESRFIEPKRRFPKPVPISPLVKLDRERCILCFRCTRFCEELSGDTLIGVMERGPASYIYPFEGESFDSYFSGNTVQICPVGALTSTPYRFQARPWDVRTRTTTCNLCASGCSLVTSVRVQDGNVIRFSAGTNEDTNEEWLCDKGRYGHAYISTTQRLLQPLIRRDQDLDEVSWDEAFRFLAERLRPVLDTRDPLAAGVVTGSSLCDEDAYAAQKFARVVLGTNSVDHRLEGGMRADALVPPQLGYDDLLRAEHAVLVSFDPREELPVVFLRLRIAATKRGLKISVVHPRRVALTELSSTHLAPLPGSEAALGAALAAALGQPVAAGVEASAAAAGVPSGDVRSFAEGLRGTGTVIVLGPRVAADAAAVRAWAAVARASGARLAWAPRRAGEYGALAVGAHPELLPGWRRVDDPSARGEIEESWQTSLPTEPGFDVGAMLERGRSGDLNALWLVGADVVRDVPDPRLGAEGLKGARFVVVQDLQHGDLLSFADVVLPAAAFVEREGTLTDWEGRRQPVTFATDSPGAARADYAILAETARRLGRPIGCHRIDDVRGEVERMLPAQPPGIRAGTDTIHTPMRSRDGERPLRLLSYRLLYDDGSRGRHTAGIRDLTPGPFVEVHPEDAKPLGIDDGATVRVSSAHGSVTAPARVTRGVRRGVVFVPYAQPGGGARELLAWAEPSPDVRVERA